jgi:hypothetical protein
MVGVAIVSVVMMSFINVIMNLNQEVRSLNQRSERLELKNSIMTSFSSSMNCAWQLNPATNPNLDSPGTLNLSAPDGLGVYPGTLVFSRLHLGSNTSAPLAPYEPYSHVPPALFRGELARHSPMRRGHDWLGVLLPFSVQPI